MKERFSICLIIAVFLLFSGCKKDEKPAGPVTDTEGNVYQTVKIGEQTWMAENLISTKLNDGTEIPLVADANAWTSLSGIGYCWYNNDEATNKDLYGALYNGYTVSTGKLCPEGWHVPDNQEWQTLTDFLGDSLSAGGKMKEAGTAHWLSPNKNADNESGYNGLPAGLRYFEGTFAGITYNTCFWTATDISGSLGLYKGLYYGDAHITTNHRNKNYGFSVRCIKD